MGLTRGSLTRGSLTRGSLTRGSLTLPRMNAHRLVIIAAALTTIVAAALATALATFSGQALPRAVWHDLGNAAGTSLVMTGTVTASQAAQYDTALPAQIKPALGGTPFSFYSSDWSDPLSFAPGALPATPRSAGAGNQPIAEAAALGDVTAQAELVSGHWPGAPAAGQPIPAALPASAAALLHVADGDVLRMKDGISNGPVRFVITGLYRPREVSSDYWDLDDIALGGSSTASGFTTYGPLTTSAAAFAGPLPVYTGTWLAQPQTASVPANQLTTVATNVDGLRQALQNAQQLPTLTLTTSLPAVLNGTASDLDVACSLLAICAVLLFLLAAAALLASARLLAGQREGESAMLTARGATRWQLLRLTAAEAIPLCLVSATAGGALGVLLAGVLASGGGTSPSPWAGGAWPDTIAAAAGVAIGQAAAVTLLRPDQSALPKTRLFGTIARTGPPPGVTLPGHAAELQLTARLGPASLGLAPVTVNVSVADADGDVYQLDAGTLPADGRVHTLTVSLANQAAEEGVAAGSAVAGGSGALFPLRLTSLGLDYTLPATRPHEAATLTLSGLSAGLPAWRSSAGSR
jgi:hypothetical protein